MKISDRKDDLSFENDYAKFRKLLKQNFRKMKKVRDYAEGSVYF